ncbi:MAG: hypothetical protein P8013_00365 [Candidatus Sulfobium sp.]|jgi:hypothetical protein
MRTEKTKDKKEKAKSGAFGFGPAMGRGMSEMIKCCTGQEGFPDCLTMMEEMKKQCCAPNKETAESEKKENE